MITITTINHSWYFIKETVIKPNASLTYDETLLNKSETKDLLESVSSKRVSLSPEDLIKVQARYDSFNSGGNVDLSGIISKIEEIYKDDGASGATLTNVEYNNGVFTYTGGTVNGYVGYTAVESISVVQSGTLTVSSMPTGVTYIAVISGNQVPNDFPSVLLILGDGTISVTQTTYPVSYGDTIEIQWTANSVSALIGGQWVSSTIGNTLNDPHLLVFSVVNTAPLYFSIPGFVPRGARSGVLVEEIDERIQADLDITADISTVRTLAETNQLNISTKTDQTDFDTLSQTVADNGFLLAQKASQTDLDTLANEVSTKATPADISAAIAALVDGAPASLDTLAEIAAALAGDQASINDLLIQISGKVRFDAAQSLTTAQQLQARQNISAEAVGVAAALIAAITAASIGAATAAQGSKADSALQSGDVAPVALSGSYAALLDKPTIPAAQVNADWASNSGLSQILNKPTLFGLSSVLTGLGAGSNTVINATDSLINALSKLQSQVSTNASSAATNASNIAANTTLIAPVLKRLGSSWYQSGLYYDPAYPNAMSQTNISVGASNQFYVPILVLESVTINQLAVNVTGAAAAGGLLQMGIYSSAADNSGPNAALFTSSQIASTSTGVKSESCSVVLTAGIYWVSYLAITAAATITTQLIPRQITGRAAITTAAPAALAATSVTSMPTNAQAGLITSTTVPMVCFRAA